MANAIETVITNVEKNNKEKIKKIRNRIKNLKSNTILIDTLYYNVKPAFINELIINTNDTSNGSFSGLTYTKMTTVRNIPILNTTLTITGYRIPPKLNINPNSYYNESYLIQNDKGSLYAIETYEDSGTGADTGVPSQKFMVLNGSGDYAYVKHIKIFYNNDQTRKIEVYAYQNNISIVAPG